MVVCYIFFLQSLSYDIFGGVLYLYFFVLIDNMFFREEGPIVKVGPNMGIKPVQRLGGGPNYHVQQGYLPFNPGDPFQRLELETSWRGDKQLVV